jgi:CubicO group peptidase (beta-lactamase class C family)
MSGVPALDLLSRWPGGARGAVVLDRAAPGRFVTTTKGPDTVELAWASVTKVALALGAMVAVDDGLISLDDPLGPPGSTVRHLLSHASGLGPEGGVPLAVVESRRIYSNAGYELLGSHLERWSGVDIAGYLGEAVLGPLGLVATRLEGSPASGMVGPLAELTLLLAEVMEPHLVSVETAAEMRRIQFPDLAGVLPGFGRCAPCPWGLGLEVKGAKPHHWTGALWGPATVGHFGQSGSFLVTDPERRVGVVTLGDEPFGPWAVEAWPSFLDAVLAEAPDARS